MMDMQGRRKAEPSKSRTAAFATALLLLLLSASAASAAIITVDGLITVGINGDFNGNDRGDIGDVAKVAFIVVEKVPEDLNADFNGNGRVDIGDAVKIAFCLPGKVSKL